MRPKRPRDLNQWAKRMVDLATGAATDATQPSDKNPAAVELGRLGWSPPLDTPTGLARLMQASGA